MGYTLAYSPLRPRVVERRRQRPFAAANIGPIAVHWIPRFPTWCNSSRRTRRRLFNGAVQNLVSELVVLRKTPSHETSRALTPKASGDSEHRCGHGGHSFWIIRLRK